MNNNNNYAIFDVETTTANKGNPFTAGNRLVYVGIKYKGVSYLYPIEFGNEPYGVHLQQIKKLLAEADVVVGFNIKFDLHWLKHYVPDFTVRAVHDCQLGEFLLSHQKLKPNDNSLDSGCERRGVSRKLNVVELEYWSKGIDTTEVPETVLRDYLGQDLLCTEELYLAQLRLIKAQGKEALFKLQCEDLLVLQEMEYNGLKYDQVKAREASDLAAKRVLEIDSDLRQSFGVSYVNFDSPAHVSVLLYGGSIKEPCIETYERRLKDGSVKIKTRKAVKYVPITGILAKPDSKMESDKTAKLDDFELGNLNHALSESGKAPLQRIYSVDEDNLRKARWNRRDYRIRDLLLERREIQKLISTYYEGCNKIIEEYKWGANNIHGQFNQNIVVTGRLSASRPNLQNFSGVIKHLFYSRYES